MTDYSTDVVVVGGGPADCILFYLLARSGVETTLVERQQTLDREFRGYGFRPPIPTLLAEMDLRDDIESLPHETISRGTLVAYGRSYPLFEFDDEQVILMKQPPLLRRIVARAREYDTFSFLDSTTVNRFLSDDGTISGVTATTRPSGERPTIQSRLVVEADGATYGERTIERAIRNTSEFYESSGGGESDHADTTEQPKLTSTVDTASDLAETTQTQSDDQSGGRERAYLKEQNKILSAKLEQREATIEQQQERIETLEAELAALRSSSGSEESDGEHASAHQSPTSDETDESSVWDHVKRFVEK